MTRSPIVFRTKQRVAFSDLDPYHHVTTAAYSRYYINHRMHGLRDTLGWDMKAIEGLPFMAWVKRMEVDFVKPALPDQELTITSFVREFRGRAVCSHAACGRIICFPERRGGSAAKAGRSA